MRDLTPEELKLAPEWATHYFIYADGGVLFESKDMYQMVGLPSVIKDIPNISIECAPIIRFNISNYKFSDKQVKRVRVINDGECLVTMLFNTSLNIITHNRDDAIAIAKHFRLTCEDLK